MPKDLELPIRLSMGATPELIARLDNWRRQHPGLPTRAAAARAILEAGLRDMPPSATGKSGTGWVGGSATSTRAKAAAPASPSLQPLLPCEGISNEKPAPSRRARADRGSVGDQEADLTAQAAPARRGRSVDVSKVRLGALAPSLGTVDLSKVRMGGLVQIF